MLKWVFIVFLGTFSNPVFADYVSGKAAYDSGNYTKAYQEFLGSAQAGDPESQYAIGYLSFEGLGTKKKLVTATEWFAKAAEQGHPYAQLHLGMIYYQGEGTPEDYRKAIKWFQLAAEQGLSEAQMQL